MCGGLQVLAGGHCTALCISVVEEVFCEFGREPLGAASLAQVHQAKLTRDGSIVAVKIQHPDVRRNGYTDMGTMDVSKDKSFSATVANQLPPSLPPSPPLPQFLVACVHWIFPEFRFQWLADEVRRNLPIELNFRCEAKNQDIFSSMFKHLSFVKVTPSSMPCPACWP